MSKTTKYIAVHRIERRIDGKLTITEPGDSITLTDDERAVLPEGAVRLPKGEPAAATDEGPAEDAKLSVAEIKDAVKTADLETLKTMLADEQAGGNRSTAVKAIEDAIASATPPAPAGAAPVADANAGAAAPAADANAGAAAPAADAGETL